jgi:hypothetical protein
VERSVAVTLMAYLVSLCLQAKHVKPDAAWSIFVLKQRFAWDVGAQQIKRTTQQETRLQSSWWKSSRISCS